MIKIGSNNIGDVRIGNSQIASVYVGSNIIWENAGWEGDFTLRSGSVSRVCPKGTYEVELYGQGGGAMAHMYESTILGYCIGAAAGGGAGYLKGRVILPSTGIYYFGFDQGTSSQEDGRAWYDETMVLGERNANKGATAYAFGGDNQYGCYAFGGNGGSGNLVEPDYIEVSRASGGDCFNQNGVIVLSAVRGTLGEAQRFYQGEGTRRIDGGISNSHSEYGKGGSIYKEGTIYHYDNGHNGFVSVKKIA